MKFGYIGATGKEYLFDSMTELCEYLSHIGYIDEDVHTKDQLIDFIDRRVFSISNQ